MKYYIKDEQTLSNSSNQKIILTASATDGANDMLVDGSFKPKVEGWYQFDAMVTSAVGSKLTRVEVRKNGVNYFYRY